MGPMIPSEEILVSQNVLYNGMKKGAQNLTEVTNKLQ